MKKILISSLIIGFLGLSFYLAFAQNFLGPSCAAGQCQGRIGVDSNGNISIGTSTPQSNTRTYVIANTSDSSAYALRILASNSSPLLLVRNDGRISIATSSFTYVLNIQGDIYTSGNITTGGNLSAPISAGNVTPGVFNSLQGSGTGAYAFLGNLGIATSSQVGLPQSLSVYGGGYFSGNVGIRTTNPASTLHVVGNTILSGQVTTTQLAITGLASSGNPCLVISSTGAVATSTCGSAGGSPAGSSGYIQFNNNGSFGGDADLFWDNINKRLGIGTTTPSERLEVVSSGSSNYFIMRSFGTSVSNGWINFIARGSASSPSNVASGDGVLFLSALGYYNGSYRLSSEIEMKVDGTPSGTTVPGAIIFSTFGSGGGGILTLNSSGNVGINTTTPSYKLDVQGGQINASGGLCIAGDCKTAWSQVGNSQWTTSGSGIYYTGNVSIGTTTISYPLFVSTSTDSLFVIQRAGATYPTIFKNGTDGALVINNNNSDVLSIKSNNVGIGTTTPSYKLDVSGAARLIPSSQPTGLNGVIYYDSSLNKFRCYQNGAWIDCIGGSKTLVHYDRYPAGNAQSESSDMGAGWGSPTGVSISPGGTSVWIQFDANTIETAYLTTTLPPTWNGGQIDFITKNTRATGVGTGNAVFEVVARCYADGNLLSNLTFSNATSTQTMNITVDGNATIHTLNFSNLDVTGCSAGDYLRIRLRRLATDAEDTFGGDAGPLEGILVWRETL
jgi:hypothetical protein